MLFYISVSASRPSEHVGRSVQVAFPGRVRQLQPPILQGVVRVR